MKKFVMFEGLLGGLSGVMALFCEGVVDYFLTEAEKVYILIQGLCMIFVAPCVDMGLWFFIVIFLWDNRIQDTARLIVKEK